MLEKNKIEACLDYTLKVLLGGQSYDALRKYISYSEPELHRETTVRLCIIPSGFFDEDYSKPSSLPRLPLEEIEGTPLLYGKPQIRRENGRLCIYADIIASTYFLVTRYEEMVRRDIRDEHGRFPGKESLPNRAGFIHRPIVDEYAALLRKWLKEAGVDVPEPKRRFSVLLTHDVDTLRKYRHTFQPLRSILSAILSRQPIRNIPESLAVTLCLKKDPLDTFSQIIAFDASCSDGLAQSPTYFFMADGKSEFDGMYNINSKVAKSTIELVHESGAQIGLHTSYEAGIRPELIAEEKASLENVCGFSIHYNRYHFLTWREIENGWALAQAGISRDSSLGYADVAGFRLGVCRPIPLFDPIKIQPFGIDEHPLIVMDCTLSNTNYMNLNEEEAFSYCKKLIDQTHKHRGEFVMLWHNTMFVPEQNNYHPKLYQKLLHELNCGGENK
ncbi:MAG: polysaccharide deacetylase family protein [Sedimentisphaerales bacterium]|nr:polysaccharide deacetylase family protein [Sedimentisphaerales bacterium]